MKLGNEDRIDFNHLQLPQMTDFNKFESMCVDLWQNNNDFETVALNGRKGQNQDGVDIYARYKSGEWLGIQCKVRSNKLSYEELCEEVKKAKRFVPTLQKFIVLTTLSRDAKIQRDIRKINETGPPFTIEIQFWDDIKDLLQKAENLTVLYKYYYDFFIDKQSLGYCVGKMLTLHLGFDGNYDTQYHLIIGKIPKYKHETNSESKYYRGVFYIANMSERTIEFFREVISEFGDKFSSCFPSDIEQAFPNQCDCWRISNWLQTVHGMDDLIADKKNNYYFDCSREKWVTYCKKNLY